MKRLHEKELDKIMLHNIEILMEVILKVKKIVENRHAWRPGCAG